MLQDAIEDDQVPAILYTLQSALYILAVILSCISDATDEMLELGKVGQILDFLLSIYLTFQLPFLSVSMQVGW